MTERLVETGLARAPEREQAAALPELSRRKRKVRDMVKGVERFNEPPKFGPGAEGVVTVNGTEYSRRDVVKIFYYEFNGQRTENVPALYVVKHLGAYKVVPFYNQHFTNFSEWRLFAKPEEAIAACQKAMADFAIEYAKPVGPQPTSLKSIHPRGLQWDGPGGQPMRQAESANRTAVAPNKLPAYAEMTPIQKYKLRDDFAAAYMTDRSKLEFFLRHDQQKPEWQKSIEEALAQMPAAIQAAALSFVLEILTKEGLQLGTLANGTPASEQELNYDLMSGPERFALAEEFGLKYNCRAGQLSQALHEAQNRLSLTAWENVIRANIEELAPHKRKAALRMVKAILDSRGLFSSL